MQHTFIKIAIFFFIIINASAAQIIPSNEIVATIDYNTTHYFAKTAAGKWGFYKSNSRVIIKAEYDTLFSLCDVEFDPSTYKTVSYQTGFFIGKKEGKSQLLDMNGTIITSVDGMMPRWMNGVVLVRNENEWGLIKTTGEFVLPIQCSEIEWHGDVLSLKEDDNWLLFDPKKGALVQMAGYLN